MPETAGFSATAIIRFGWETFKKRSWFFIGVTFLFMVLTGFASGIGAAFGNQGVASGIGSIINFVLSTFIGMGITSFFLKAHDDPAQVESTALWHPQHFWYYLAATLLVGALVVLGAVLLIVPGIIVALMFMFSTYIVVDRGLGPIEAMRESKHITRGHKWKLLGLALLAGLINVLGVLCLVVGLLVTIPLTMLALVHAYRILSQGANQAPAV